MRKLLIKIRNWFGRSGLTRAIENPHCDWESPWKRLGDKWYDVWGEVCYWYDCWERFFFWGWKMRKSHDWDSHFLLDVMYLKLKRMEYSFENHGHLVWNSCKPGDEEFDPEEYKGMKALKLAIKILKRLKDRDSTIYHRPLEDKHDAKWGKLECWSEPCEDSRYSRFMSKRPNANTPELEEQEINEHKLIWDAHTRMWTRDNKNFFKIMEKYHRGWWD